MKEALDAIAVRIVREEWEINNAFAAGDPALTAGNAPRFWAVQAHLLGPLMRKAERCTTPRKARRLARALVSVSYLSRVSVRPLLEAT